MTTHDILTRLGACPDAIDWAAAHPDHEEAWHASVRGDHLLWIAAKLGVDRKLVVLAACACARTTLVHVPEGEDRPRIAIETAEAWARGEVVIEQVRAACTAAYAAAYASDAAYAAYAAAAAAYAAADVAAAYASYAAAKSADIVRSIIPWSAVAERVEAIA